MGILQDLRYALRMLARNPGFSAVVVITLALGIGANSAIFSLVNAVLLRPLPFPHSEQLVRVYSEFPAFPHGGLHRFWISGPEYLELRQDAHSWQSLDAWTTQGANLSGDSQPLRVQAALVTGGLLPGLGVTPARGRWLTADDDRPGAPRALVLSWELWRRAYGGDTGIIGGDTEFNGSRATIVGVMPPQFQFPLGQAEPVEVWTPLQLNPASPGGRASHYLYLVGRLRAGMSPARAQSEFQSLEAAYGREGHSAHQHNFSPDFHPISSYPLQSEVTGPVRPALLLLLGAVGLVLLIACVNVASLLLARAEARQREIAIRGALGAGTARLLRQFVTEGIVLAGAGAALGLVLADLVLRLIQTSPAASLPLLSRIGLDGRVLLFTAGLSLATGVVFGLTPLAHVAGHRLYRLLKSSGGAGTTRGAQRFRQVLVIGEIGLALVLLVGAGLMLRALWNLQRVQLGFQPDGLMTMQVALPGSDSAAQKDTFIQRLQSQLPTLTGVRAAAIAYGLPPNRPPDDNDTGIEGFVQRTGGPIQNVEYYQAVSPGYFATMGIPVLAGRAFDQRDGTGSTPVAIVNQRMAETFWPGQNPIGHRVQPGQSGPWATVIGEVGDVKNKGVDQPAGTEMYLPFGQPAASGTGAVSIITQGAAGASGDAAVNAVRAMVRRLDPSLPLAHVASMPQILATEQARPRLLTWLLLAFAGVALLLAAVGVYGVMNYSVARRTREFGLRAAIGAGRGDLLALVLRQGMTLTLAGVAAGGLIAFAATRLMNSLLYGVGAADPVTFAATAALLLLVALGACWVPAYRATRVDPMTALRED
ncbi:MAG TPA: ABC transporter permease [Terriglobales bacterium]|nr:ABC transporter permease [Terriglobales bacterium]